MLILESSRLALILLSSPSSTELVQVEHWNLMLSRDYFTNRLLDESQDLDRTSSSTYVYFVSRTSYGRMLFRPPYLGSTGVNAPQVFPFAGNFGLHATLL